MNKTIIFIIVEIIQIFLSINLIIRQKNGIAILSEIITSFLLLYIINGLSIEIDVNFWKYLVLVALGYLVVKIFLVAFVAIVRIYCFNTIKKLRSNNAKIDRLKSKTIYKFCKVKYWPRLKLGLPDKAGKTNPITKVKFDSKGFPKFKCYYTVKLQMKDLHKTREQHFYTANKMLYKNILSNPKLKAKFTKQEIKEFSNGITPNKYTWHHHQNIGILQLVDYSVHSKTYHIGGYTIWGGK